MMSHVLQLTTKFGGPTLNDLGFGISANLEEVMAYAG